jgi:hypothetical protein
MRRKRDGLGNSEALAIVEVEAPAAMRPRRDGGAFHFIEKPFEPAFALDAVTGTSPR